MTEAADGLTHSDRELRARLRFVLAALMAVFTIGWITWHYPFDDLFDRSGMQLGGDFPVFYVQARMAAEGKWKELYDFREQGIEMRKFLPLPDEHFLPALYPPWTAAMLRPLAYFNYPWAYAVFFSTSLALLTLTVWSWTRTFSLAQGPWKSVVILGAFGFPLILESLISGQASVVAVALFGIGAALIQQNRLVLAGVVLGFAAYKPNVLLLVLVGMALRWPRTIIGMAITGAGLLALTAATAGLESTKDYLELPSKPDAKSALANPPVRKFHGIAASTPFTRNTPVRATIFGLAVIGVLYAVWRSRTNSTEPDAQARDASHSPLLAQRAPNDVPLFLASLGMLQVLGNPYMPIYDLAILCPIAFLFLQGLSERYGPSVGRHAVFAHVGLALLLFGAHASQAFASQTEWQPFGWLFLPAAFWTLWELSAATNAKAD